MPGERAYGEIAWPTFIARLKELFALNTATKINETQANYERSK